MALGSGIIAIRLTVALAGDPDMWQGGAAAMCVAIVRSGGVLGTARSQAARPATLLGCVVTAAPLLSCR